MAPAEKDSLIEGIVTKKVLIVEDEKLLPELEQEFYTLQEERDRLIEYRLEISKELNDEILAKLNEIKRNHDLKERDIVSIEEEIELRSSENLKILQELEDLTKEHEEIDEKINNLLKGKIKDFSYYICIINDEQEKILINAKFSLITDKFQDILGVLFLGYQVKELRRFKKVYHVTDREVSVIQQIINGSTNKEAAQILNVTENTIKSHITNIYNKLTVNNKVELINLLQEYKIIPEQKAEKQMLLLNKNKFSY